LDPAPQQHAGAGEVMVDLVIANYDDRVRARLGLLAPEKVRELTVRGVVALGRSGLVLPQRIAEELGVSVLGQVKVRYPDGREILREEVGYVDLRLLGRDDPFSATGEPELDVILLGRIVLTALDLVVDGSKQRLVARHPKYRICEV
jgi:hypothetical protein